MFSLPDFNLPDDPSERREFWMRLFNQPCPFNSDDFLLAYRSVTEETDLELRTLALAALGFLGHREAATAPPDPGRRRAFQDLLWGDFASTEADSAVVAVSDREKAPDFQALIQLGRFLSLDRCEKTSFHQVELSDPVWGPLKLGHLGAICFVGRPASFTSCSLVDALPENRVFELPADAVGMRGQPVTKHSAEVFHHVLQKRPQAGALKFRSQQRSASQRPRRHDFAVAQRFRVRHGAKYVTIVVLAGATGLGTYAAAEWATSGQADKDLHEAMASMGSDPQSVEVLLEVSGMVHDPPRLWDPEETKVRKIFVNGKRFADEGPDLVTLCLGRKGSIDVRYVLFDDDEVQVANPNVLAALVAVCLKASTREPGATLDLKELWAEAGVWPEAKSGEQRRLGDPVAFLREMVKRDYLMGKLHVIGAEKGKGFKLDCRVEFRDAEAKPQPIKPKRKAAAAPIEADPAARAASPTTTPRDSTESRGDSA